ncbi:flagellar hook-associated protein FlgK [Hyphomonas sp.]|uniref:flagellar hook-associated protein FlgK n=1 Tax=Hyphomonas sp. TaxID=87 RepID=UPI00391D00B3
MSISSALNIARTGLHVSGLRAETVAANVANASTPGYVRRSVAVSETISGGRSSGVQVVGIERAPDAVIKSQRRALTSDTAQATVLAQTWKALSTRLGSTADGSGLFKAFSDLDTALARAVTAPETATNLTLLMNAAKGITRELASLSEYTASLRAEADREIAAGVDTVNTALQQIESLNRRLAGIDRTSAQAAALFDERQRALDTISEYMPVKAIERDAGAIDVITPEGVFLLVSNARQIEFQPGTAFTPDSTLAGGTLSGISVDGTPLTPGSTSFGAVSSGLFGALFTLRDQDLPAFSAQLDFIAADLISRFSGSADPTLAPGDPGLFIDADPAGGPGLAARLAINAAADPQQGGELWRLRDGMNAVTEGPPGNNGILSVLQAAFRTGQPVNSNGFQGLFSATELAAQFASLTGQTRLFHEGVAAAATAQHATLMEAELRLTGVDIDDQMQQLLLIEQAFAANARVIQVASEMIRVLMEL